MQRDFHYYVVYALAKEAGYGDNEANIIAYISQHGDNNTDREYTVSDSYEDFYVEFPEEDPFKSQQIPRPKFVEIEVKDVNAHWFRFQSAAKKQLAMVLGMIGLL